MRFISETIIHKMVLLLFMKNRLIRDRDFNIHNNKLIVNYNAILNVFSACLDV